MTTSHHGSRATWSAGALDFVLVAAFAMTGRSTHGSDLLSVGYLETLYS